MSHSFSVPASKVSRRLTQGIAPEVIEHIYRPRLAGELEATFPYLSALNEEHLVTLARQGIVTPQAAATLVGALRRMAEEGPGAIEVDPMLEDAYFNVEARIIALVCADAGGRLHIGRSRNDLSAALGRLRMRGILLDLLEAAAALRRSRLDQANDFAELVVPRLHPLSARTAHHLRLLSLRHRLRSGARRGCRRLGGGSTSRPWVRRRWPPPPSQWIVP
jgi:hypothetical protein